MATAYVVEYARKARDAEGYELEAGEEPSVASEKITFTTTTQSAAFDKRTSFILIEVDAAAHWKVGVNPTAVNTDGHHIPANTKLFLGLNGDMVRNGDLEIAFVTA